MDFSHISAGRIASALDVDNLDALFNAFVNEEYLDETSNLPAGQASAAIPNVIDSNPTNALENTAVVSTSQLETPALQLPEVHVSTVNPHEIELNAVHHPTTGGKTVESLVATGLIVDSEDETGLDFQTEYLGLETSDEETFETDASFEHASKIQRSNDAHRSNDNNEQQPVTESTGASIIRPGRAAFVPQDLPFKFLDDEEKQDLVVKYIDAHQEWFTGVIGDKDNLHQIFETFPDEIGAFLSNDENENTLSTIRDKYPTLFSSNDPSHDQLEDNSAALTQFLSNHANKNTLSAVFANHPKILAHALKSLDDSSVLFAFLSKHRKIVGNFLEQHKNLDILADFFNNHPVAMNHVLEEEPSILENYLTSNRQALHALFDAKPHILHDYFIAQPAKLEKWLKNNPSFLESFLAKHAESVNQDRESTPEAVDANPTLVDSSTEQHLESITEDQASASHDLDIDSTSDHGSNYEPDHESDHESNYNSDHEAEHESDYDDKHESDHESGHESGHESNYESEHESEHGSEHGSDYDDKPSSSKTPQKQQRAARSSPAATTVEDGNNAEADIVLPARAAVPYPAPAEALAKDLLKPLGRATWTLREEDCAIKHMLAVNAEKKIKGEARFEEAARRMNVELGVDRSRFSFKNFWNRTGRARSGLDERRCKKAALATSLQGKARKKAVAKKKSSGKAAAGAARSRVKRTTGPAKKAASVAATPPADTRRTTLERPSFSPITNSEGTPDPEPRKRKSEEPEEEEGQEELGSLALAAAFGTREKKKVKYTY